MRRTRLIGTPVLLASLTLGGLVLPPDPVSAEAPSGLDPAYGDAGVAVLGNPESSFVVASDSDPSGRVVVLGIDTGQVELTRLTTGGDTDDSFGGDGSAPLPAELAPYRVLATSSAIYVTGQVAHGEGAAAPGIARFTTAGELDLAWGGDGVVEAADPAVGAPTVQAIDAGPAGEVVAAVRPSGTEGSPGYTLVRVANTGTVDPDFGDEGSLVVPAPRDVGWDGVKVDSTGRIVVADVTEVESGHSHRVRRLLATGEPDAQFGTGGTTDLGEGVALTAAISPIDGSIVLGGGAFGEVKPVVWKVLANGQPDSTFGVGGRAAFAGSDMVRDLVVLPSHHIAVATAAPGAHAFLVRPNGALESQFGTEGSVPAPTWSPWDGLGVGADGQLLVVSTDLATGHSEVRAFVAPTLAPTITSVTAGRTSLSVHWDAAEVQLDGPVRGYYVYAVDGAALVGAASVAGDVRQVSLAGVPNDKAVKVTVLPFTDKGAGFSSDPVTATASASAAAATPSGAVRDLAVTSGNRFATATWAAPADDGGAPIALYAVVAVRKDTNAVVGWRNVPADVRSASFTLTNGIAHSVIVMPYTSQGLGAVAPAVTVTPLASGGPSQLPVLPFAAAKASGTSAYVAWGPGTERGQAITGYQVVVVRDGAVISWVSQGADVRSATVQIGASGSVDVYVIPSSASGLGAPSAPLHVRG